MESSSTNNVYYGVSQGGEKELSILGKVQSASLYNLSYGDVTSTNFALSVIQAISNIGIERFTNSLQDVGNFQNQVAFAQTAIASMQEGFSLIEQDAYWNSSSQTASFSSDLANPASRTTLNTMMSSFFQLFDNQGDFNGNTSVPTYSSISLAFPKPHGGYVIVQPYYQDADKVWHTNQQALTMVNDFITALNQFMLPGVSSSYVYPLPSSAAQAATMHMPIYQAMALSELQVKIDQYPKYLVDPSGNFINPPNLANLFGAFNADAPLEAIQSIATTLTANYQGDGGQPFLNFIDHLGENVTFALGDYAQPLADMVADYLQTEYAGQSNTPSPPSPLPGLTGNTGQFSSLTVFADLKTSFSTGSGELQTQTQKNSSQTQIYSSQITSLDQTGQAVIEGVQQSQSQMVQNQTRPSS